MNDYFGVLFAINRQPGKITFGIRNTTTGDTGSRIDLHSSSTLNHSTWYDVACVYSADEHSIYINGVLDATTAGGTALTNTKNCSVIGDYYSSDQGIFISDIVIFSRALSATEIRAYLNR